MPGNPFWLGGASSLATEWDTLNVMSSTGLFTQFPGIARIHGVSEWEIKKVKNQGTDGQDVKDKGMKARKIQVELKIWTSTQWTDLQTSVSLLGWDTLGTSRGPVSIGHPMVTAMGVGPVDIEKIEYPPPNAKDGMLIKMMFVENVTIKPTIVLPSNPSFFQGIPPEPGEGGIP